MKKWLWIAGATLLALIVAAALFFGLGKGGKTGGEQNQEGGPTATYTIEVKSASGILLKDVGLYIYEDSSLGELVSFLKTDENGKTSFTDVQRDTYVAVLDKVPTGYVAEEQYPLTGELTEIILQTGSLEDADLENLTYKLGDAVLDFTVTGPDGTEYTLSELFKGKKAVVLNFFYNACQPCMLEFPYLQEAYAEYSDRIAVLAMNPYDGDDAAVAALQKELGLTFPMVKCGPEWQKIMGISAYPTTVVIDRFGNICLIHTGSVPDAKTFRDMFAWFCAEDYEQKLIKDINDLLIEEPKGTEDNPEEIGGQNSFQTTVAPGQVMYHDLYKVFNMYLQIKSPNAYVIYNGKTYEPKNGVVGLMVSAPDTFTPAKIGIGNSGTEEETFTVYLSALKGSFDNPYTLTIGEVEVDIDSGNEQGVYYVYTPTEDGTLILQCLNAPSGVRYGYSLFNTVTNAMRNLESDSQTAADGTVTVSVTAKAGQKIQICFGTLPDSNYAYPGGHFKYLATFQAGEVADQEKEVKTDYTVTVLDDAKQPIANVSVLVEVEGQKTGFTTDSNGVAKISLTPGSYKGEIYVPDGYVAKTTTFELTEENPNVTLNLEVIKTALYTVRVQDPEGMAVAGVLVKIGEGSWLTTDATGTVAETLDIAAYPVTVMIPAGYSGEAAHTFEEGKTELVIVLEYPEGSLQNPYDITAYPYTTPKFSKGKEAFFRVTPGGDMLGIAIRNADAYIRCEDVTIGADAQGIVRYLFEGSEPVVLAIGNGGTTRESYTVEAIYAPGSEQNPLVVNAYPYTTPAIRPDQDLHVRFEKVEKVLGFTAADRDLAVTYGNTTVTPDENGVLTYTFLEANSVLVLHNSGAEEKTFTLEAVVPAVGSEENPEVLTGLSNLTRKLEAGDSDGYYYTYTTNKTGTLSLRLLQAISVGHDVELYTVSRYSLMSESGTLRQVAIDMLEGETVTIHIYTTQTPEGEFPTANFRMRLSFTEKAIEEPTEPTATEPTVTEPTVTEPTVTEPTVTEPTVTEPTATEPTVTEPTATEPSVTEPEEYCYTVTVTDIFGAGQKNIGVMFLKDGAPVEVVTTDSDGIAEHYTEELESYTVELVFSGKEYYYDKTLAVLTPNSRELTIKLIANIDTSDYYPIYILNDNPAYTLYTGGTRVELGTGKPNFSAEYENNCFFVFTPQQAGTYQVSVAPDVPLSYWSTTNFINKMDDKVEDNVITFSISGSAVKNTTYVIGIKGDSAVADAVVNVARIGEPEFSIADQPWTEWATNLSHTEAWRAEVGLTAQPGNAYFDLAKAPKYMDLTATSGTYNLYYDAANGYYRLYENGPVILVDLNAKNRFVSLYERVNGNGQYGGSAVTRYFFDSTGKFVRKEAYTGYLQECFAQMNLDAYSEKGYYPLTKDMMYVLQNGFCQWWDEESPNYLEGFATANKEYAWMFACCYVE